MISHYDWSFFIDLKGGNVIYYEFDDEIIVDDFGYKEKTKHLGKYWCWEHFNDGTGHLLSPNGNKYFIYDFSTQEYKKSNNDMWHIMDSLDNSKYFSDAEKYIKGSFIELKENITAFNKIIKNWNNQLDINEPFLQLIPDEDKSEIIINYEMFSPYYGDYISCNDRKLTDISLISKLQELDINNVNNIKEITNGFKSIVDMKIINDEFEKIESLKISI